jgi:DNA-binding transcriptional ArsR family regulator
MHLPLNALRAFEASARHLNLTRAALELHVTQTAVSQHIRKLEEHLGKPLFRRLPRGLALTDEGLALLPTLSDAFARMETALEQIRENRPREVLTVGVVGTFAVGWLLPRLRHFSRPTRLWTCACLPTTTGWTWPERAGLCHPLWRRGTGMAPTPSRFFRHHSRPCAHPPAQGCSSR